MKKIFIATVYFNIVLLSKLSAQDLSFSQFYENPLLRNPALAGVFDGDVRVTGTFRNQWQSITVPYRTEALSTEVRFPIGDHDDWITGGLQITHDAAGDIQLQRTQLLPVINYHKSFGGDNYLSAAVMGGPVESQFDPTLLKLGDQFDSQTGGYNPNMTSAQQFSKTGYTYWDLSAGLSWSSSFDVGDNVGRYYIGAGLFHVNRPKTGYFTNINTETTINQKNTFSGGLTIPVSDVNKVIFYLDYLRQGGNKQFLGGVMYEMDVFHDYSPANENRYGDIAVYGGAFYRWNDAIIPMIKFDVYSLSFGVSYDVTLSKLKTASQTQGGLEFTLSYKARLNNRRGGEYGGGQSATGRRRKDEFKCAQPVFP